jgi:hypothetical protein
MDFGLFNMVFVGVGPPIVGAADAMALALQGWMRPILISGVILYAICKNIWDAVRGRGNPMGDTLAIMVSGSIITYAATEAAGLGPQARDLLLNRLSTEIGQVVLQAVGGRALSADLFDDAIGRAWGAGLDALNRLPPYSLKAIVPALGILVYWWVALACVAMAYFIWLTAFVATAVFVGFWPLGVGLFAFPWTRRLAWGWLSLVLGSIVLQIMVVAVLSVLIGALLRVINEMQVAGTNEIAQVGRLIASTLVFGLLAWVAKQLPGYSASWTHGMTGFGQTSFIRMPEFFGSGGGSGQGQQDQAAAQNAAGVPVSSPAALPQSAPPGRSIG